MGVFFDDLASQADALRQVADFYMAGEGAHLLSLLPPVEAPVFTGMGSSFHAAWIATLRLQNKGFPVQLLEATHLLYACDRLISEASPLVYVSQSGASGEIPPLLNLVADPDTLIGITNQLDSPLARGAGLVLPLIAGPESTVACKTYLNTLAVMWLMVRRWTGEANPQDYEILNRIAGRIDSLMQQASQLADQWLNTFEDAHTLIFSGHGAQAATARQAAQTVIEWARFPALDCSAGAFRHGFIEAIQPGVGAILFMGRGPSRDSIQRLADELKEYGAAVLVVDEGYLDVPGEETILDETCAAILNIVPAQIYAEAFARYRQVPEEFRYLTKITKKV